MLIPKSKTFPYASRRGFTLAETTAAGLLLIVALASFAQILGWVAGERRAFERRRLALATASNLMERATALPWDRLNDDSLQKLWLSGIARANLPKATLSAEFSDEKDDGIESKKINLTIRWIGSHGVADRPVRLVGWVYRPRRKS